MNRKNYFKIALVLLCSSFAFSIHAESDFVPIKGAKFDVNASLVSNLKGFVGKQVGITDRLGRLYTGSLIEVSEKNVLIQNWPQRSKMNTLIRSSEIIGIQARFREPAGKVK